MQAIAAANQKAHDPGSTDQPWPTVANPEEGAQADSAPAAHTSEMGRSADDEYAPRLVTGDARCEGHRVQVWVNQDGLLILPAQTVPHGPLDPSDNPRFQRATFNSAHALRLAEHHAGQWVPYAHLGKLQLADPDRSNVGGKPRSMNVAALQCRLVGWELVHTRCCSGDTSLLTVALSRWTDCPEPRVLSTYHLLFSCALAIVLC
jgi:hypothetical protein